MTKGGEGGFCWGGVEPAKFSKRGAWQNLNFERGVAGKEGGCNFPTKKKNKQTKI